VGGAGPQKCEKHAWRIWAFGHFSHNYQQSYSGRRGVIVSGVAALLIGASSQIIGFFFSQGVNLH
jgi:hypothetical protein